MAVAWISALSAIARWWLPLPPVSTESRPKAPAAGPLPISTSSSMRTPMPLYFSKAVLTAAMNFSFSGVLGRLSSASGRI
jgi:hypothetical protein